MEIQEILQELRYFQEGHFPRKALEAAVEQREAIVPELLKLLETTIAREQASALEDNEMGHVFALYLLAQFREQRAFPLAVEFFSLSAETLGDGDEEMALDDGGRMLAAFSGGKLESVAALARDATLHHHTRVAGLAAIETLVTEDPELRPRAIEILRELFEDDRKQPSNPQSQPWVKWTDSLVGAAIQLVATELLPQIRQAYAEDRVDPGFNGSLEEVERDLEDGNRSRITREPIRNAVEEMASWHCFKPTPVYTRPQPTAHRPAVRPAQSESLYQPDKVQEPVRRQSPKVGRNDPCPCGSGKKYKKCCGANA